MTPEQHAIVVRTLLTGIVEHDAPIPVGGVPDDSSWRWVPISQYRTYAVLQTKQLAATYGDLATSVMLAARTRWPNCACHHCKTNHANR